MKKVVEFNFSYFALVVRICFTSEIALIMIVIIMIYICNYIVYTIIILLSISESCSFVDFAQILPLAYALISTVEFFYYKLKQTVLKVLISFPFINFLIQEQIFHDLGSPLLKKALEGYNVTMYAYGQVKLIKFIIFQLV